MLRGRSPRSEYVFESVLIDVDYTGKVGVPGSNAVWEMSRLSCHTE
jgi:hypothetical protein